MDADLKNFLLSHAIEGIIVTDMEGNILQSNETAQLMLGYRGPDPHTPMLRRSGPVVCCLLSVA